MYNFRVVRATISFKFIQHVYGIIICNFLKLPRRYVFLKLFVPLYWFFNI